MSLCAGDSLEADMVCDITDALDLSGAPNLPTLVARANRLGWTLRDSGHGYGWLTGRRFMVMFELGPTGWDATELYLYEGMLTCRLQEPLMCVCGGPPMLPFPEEEDLLAEFDAFYKENGCDISDRPLVAAAHRVLCAWFDFLI